MKSLLLASLLVLLVASTAHADRTYAVRYRVVGAHFDVTYTNASGGTVQRSNINRRMEVTFRAPAGAFLYLSAQNNGEAGGVRCMIDVDGKRVVYAGSQGAYVISSCDYGTD